MKKRILVLLSVVALMVAMLAMSVTPAFAGWQTEGPDAGCRGTDQRVSALLGPFGVNGKRSDDAYICERVRFNRNTGPVFSYYDNRPL